jgi:ferredoxin
MLMVAAKVDSGKCTGCGKCVDACPVEAIKMQDGKAVIGEECAECGACLDVCPNGALSL